MKPGELFLFDFFFLHELLYYLSFCLPCSIFCGLNFLILQMKTVYFTLRERLVAALSERMAWGQISYLTVKWEIAYWFVVIIPNIYNFALSYRNMVNVRGRGKYYETLLEFCRRTLHARLQTGPGGDSEQSELPLTNFCLLVDFLLDIVSLVRIALFITNIRILYIYSLQKYYIYFINCFFWKYIDINGWIPLKEVFGSLYDSW